MSPHEYEADAGSLPQRPPFDDPTDPKRPFGVGQIFGVVTTEPVYDLWYMLQACASDGKYSRENAGVFIDNGVCG